MRSMSSVLLVVFLGLSGCAAVEPPVPGGWATYSDMRTYYRQHAWEWDGRCRAPYLDGLLKSRVVEETPGRLELLVTYVWRDRIGDETGSGEFQVAGGTDRCRGIDERTFTFEKLDGGGLRTVAMSGLERGGRVPALFH